MAWPLEVIAACPIGMPGQWLERGAYMHLKTPPKLQQIMVRLQSLFRSLLVSLGLASLLAACGTTSTPVATGTAVKATAQEVAIVCGQARVSMQCERTSSGGCIQSRLMWQTGAEQAKSIQPPAEVGADRFPMGLACMQGRDGTPMVAVQYASFPRDCKFCEFLFLYDGSGRLLTRSEPLILGVGAEQRPNLEQFDQLLKSAGSPKLSWTYLR